MSQRHLDISLRVNGEDVRERVEARKTLVDFLRDDLSFTGTHVGCEHGVCGACTVLLDGDVVRGCLLLAVQCDGAVVETIEGLSDAGTIADLQLANRSAFLDHAPRDFVAQYHRFLHDARQLRPIAIGHVQVRMTNSASLHFDQHIIVLEFRPLDFFHRQRLLEFVEDSSLHSFNLALQYRGTENKGE